MDNKFRHLEMIQSIIKRMASNSFLLKGWVVSIIVAIFVLSAKDSNSYFFVITFVPLLTFWILDSYYLQQERLFRNLYKKVVCLKESNIDFSIDITEDLRDKKTKLVSSIFSITELIFYLPLLIIIVLVYFLVK